MPSYSSPEESPTQRGQATTDNQSVITVGDRVEITDCPGHWSWASPFTVEAIESEMVKLEMVNELIEIGRLQKCQK
jgi:putative DNA primase/helicase